MTDPKDFVAYLRRRVTEIVRAGRHGWAADMDAAADAIDRLKAEEAAWRQSVEAATDMLRIVRKDRDALAAENAELRKRGEWQPVDSAPMDASDFYAMAFYYEGVNTHGVGYRTTEGRVFAFDSVGDRFEPTHWRPLPAPPETSNG